MDPAGDPERRDGHDRIGGRLGGPQLRRRLDGRVRHGEQDRVKVDLGHVRPDRLAPVAHLLHRHVLQDEERLLAADEPRSTAQQREQLLRVAFAGFDQGSKAMVQEARLLSEQGWGFNFEDVDYSPIKIWHGTNDTDAPVEMIRYMANRLPHATLKEFDETHFSMASHVEEILEELTSENFSTNNREVREKLLS